MIDVSNPDPRFQPRDIPLIADAPKLDVLVVEDDEADAYLIRTALRRNPKISRVVFAGDGFEALHHLDRGAIDPDVAIIDLNMPRKNGFSLLVDLACRPNSHMKTIVLTSSTAIQDASRSRLRGADCFLTKPDTIEELDYVLTSAISYF